MAEDRGEAREISLRQVFGWTELLRLFLSALDARKLVLAAGGIFSMWAGWAAISWAFHSLAKEPKLDDPAGYYTNDIYRTRYDTAKGYPPEEFERRKRTDYEIAKAQWHQLDEAARPGGITRAPDGTVAAVTPPGKFRGLPWTEYRGPNPFLLVTGQAPLWQQGHFFDQFLVPQLSVMTEPLVKFLLPFRYLLSPNAGWYNKLYALTLIVWAAAVWAFFGGVITRLTAVSYANADQIGLSDSVRYVAARYANYFLPPVVPLLVIGLAVVALAAFGVVQLIPAVGDILVALLWPAVFVAGFLMAVALVWLLAYPLMYPAASADDSDFIDASGRSLSFLMQHPKTYLGYALVALLYGALLVFFVNFLASSLAYLSKWGVSQVPNATVPDRSPEYYFVFAPESFQWRELLTKDDPQVVEAAKNPASEPSKQYWNSWYWYNYFGAGVVSSWTVLLFMLMLGFGYSYFWTAATTIYLLLRRKHDHSELDEIALTNEEGADPYAPPVTAPTAAPARPAPAAGSGLQMVDPPQLRSSGAAVTGGPASASTSSATSPPASLPVVEQATGTPTASPLIPAADSGPPPQPPTGTPTSQTASTSPAQPTSLPTEVGDSSRPVEPADSVAKPDSPGPGPDGGAIGK